MIRRPKDVEAEVIRLIVTSREKFPHSVAWNDALKRVIWRYATLNPPDKPRRKSPRKQAARD